jgi:TPR repeat protein
VAANIIQAVTNDTLPTAHPIKLKEIVFNLAKGEHIIFPENLTLDACRVESGEVSFHHGTVHAIGSDAIVIACGENATANAVDGAYAVAKVSGSIANATGRLAIAHAKASGTTANATGYGTFAFANASGATANATAAWAKAEATAPGATANAMTNGARAYARVSGATANARARGAQAGATACGATANATVGGAEAFAHKSGSTANATGHGASANAEASGAIANATENQAEAYARTSGAITYATADGARAIAAVSGSIAIVGHALASANVKYDAKAMQYDDFMAMRQNLDKCWNNNVTVRERAGAGFLIGMAFCDGKGVKQSDKLATFFLSAAHELGHPNAIFELGELYSKKRSSFRRDLRMANEWYSMETPHGKKIRELTPAYALLRQSMKETNSALHVVPEDVLNVIGSFLSKL